MIKLGSGALNAIYPVGSIYMSVNNINPTTIFGGTWEQIKDRFLLACGNTYQNGATGGEASVTLSVSQIPAHKHALAYGPNINGEDMGWNYALTASSASNATSGRGWSSNLGTKTEGHGQPHNNMPPYLAVYIWKRTA